MKFDQKITPCIWFDNNASEAVKFYMNVFENGKIITSLNNTEDSNASAPDSVLTIGFELEGFRFLALNGGATFRPNPSISFFVNTTDKMHIKRMWDKLSKEGIVRMELDEYDYSPYYGWIEDKYGVSWQLMKVEKEPDQKIVPCLLFTEAVYGRAEEAANFYSSVFPDSSMGMVARYPAGSAPDKEGAIMYADLQLSGEKFVVMESGHEHRFQFNEGVSLMVNCETQDEIDQYWNKLTEGGKEVQCGWLQDKFGVSWQIVPKNILRLIKPENKEKSKRAMKAMMGMIKLNIKELEEA